MISKQQLFYANNGYLFPIPVLEREEVDRLRTLLERYTQKHAQQVASLLPRERRSVFALTHLSLPWVAELVANPRVLDAVAQVIGPDILVWESNWFIKFPRDRSYISWHQDAAYWGLSPPQVTTAWIALTPSIEANGCVRVLPGSHTVSYEQRDTYAEDNALSRGQEIAVEVDETRAVGMELQPGEMSLHHIGVAHSSRANTSAGPRIGLAVRYIAPHVVQNAATRQLALLVRGTDAHGHFELVSPPRDEASGERVRQEAEQRLLASVMPTG
ncbi:MAG: phytanoyl-CoA dioxygenase family protein [Chloroflexota bacterium]